MKAVRVKDIAGRLQVKLPMITGMLNTLVQKGPINHEKIEKFNAKIQQLL